MRIGQQYSLFMHITLLDHYVNSLNIWTASADPTNVAQHTEYRQMFSLHFISNIKYFTRCENICTCEKFLKLSMTSDYCFV